MYRNAADILPPDLLAEIQKYVQGKEIYIPKHESNYLGWGERNGARHQIRQRNQEIREKYRSGVPIEILMESYYLSYDSIRRIIRGQT